MSDQLFLFPELASFASREVGTQFSPVVLDKVPFAISSLPSEDISDKIFKAKAVLKWLLSNHRTGFSTSYGKDSSTTLGLALAAAAELAQANQPIQPFVVLTADTGCENPSVKALADRETRKVEAWINRFALPATTHVAHPSLSSQFAVAVLGGRALPSIAGTKRDCTSDWKVVPLSRLRKKVLGTNNIPAGAFVVSVTGVRRSESVVRAGNLAARRESDIEIVQTSAKGNVALAPIIEWSYDDVFEYLGLCANGLEETYSDMTDVINTYRDALGECALLSSDEANVNASKPCSARFGCWNCLQVKSDRSMDKMVEEAQHAYMKPLAAFRTFLKNTYHDQSRRTWVGRSIDENGYIRFAIDGYSPAMLQDLLKYALTIDIEEREAAASLGISPRFQIVSLESLLAISAHWSLQGFALPFTALALYRDIVNGKRYPIPDVPKQPIPPARYIHVGKGWDQGANWQYTGLRDVMADAFGGEGCIGHKEIISKGQVCTVMDVNISELFSIDPEGATMFMMFEMDRLVDEWHGPAARRHVLWEGHHVAAIEYRFYASYGLLSMAKGQIGKIDEILRRTSYRERLGLAGYHYDHNRAMALSVAAPTPIVPSQAEREIVMRADVAALRATKRSRLSQTRLNLVDLASDWAPDVNWRRLVQQKTLRMIAIPRSRRGRLVLRHLISIYKLLAFLKENPEVMRRVQAFRGKKKQTKSVELFSLAA